MKIGAVLAIMGTIVMSACGDVIINVSGQQRQNANLVDIYYDLESSSDGLYNVKIEIIGRTNEVSATTFTGDVGDGISPGRNRYILWDIGADWQNGMGDVKVIVTATKEVNDGKHGKVQLWEEGPYWSTTNIGADNPWEYGLYFWWGDTTGSHPSGTTFDFDFRYDNSVIETYMNTASELQSTDWATENGVLKPNHDAAHVKWGGDWRMPTDEEFEDLSNKCDWSLSTMNGVTGYTVRGRGDYASNTIFLPCTGFGYGTSLYTAGSRGLYWASSLFGGNYDTSSYCLSLDSSDRHGVIYNYRDYGQVIRPVLGLGASSTTEALTGASAWFFVDTTDRTHSGSLVIIDFTKMMEPFLDEQGGRLVIVAKEGQTLTEADVDTVIVSSPLDSTKDITEAYLKTLVDNQIVIKLSTPAVESVEEGNKDEDDASGMLVGVAEEKIEAKPTADDEKGEKVGALPVKTYPGLWYQAEWGDDLGNLTPGEKVQATGYSLYLGVIKQKGVRGFYRLNVSETK